MCVCVCVWKCVEVEVYVCVRAREARVGPKLVTFCQWPPGIASRSSCQECGRFLHRVCAIRDAGEEKEEMLFTDSARGELQTYPCVIGRQG